VAESSVPDQQKKCKKCGELKFVHDFSTSRELTRSGEHRIRVRATCKQCNNLHCREYRRDYRSKGIKKTVQSDVEPTTKRCIRCGDVKPIEIFQWSGWRLRVSGELRRYRGSYCTPCANEYARNRENIKAKKAAYQRQYTKTSRGRTLKRLNRIKNKETHNAKCRLWVAQNLEKRRLVVRISQQKRRLKGWDVKSAEIRAAIEQTLELARIGDQYLDAYSGELIDDPTIDHIVPISKGGTNDPDNLCVTSMRNNASKFNDSLLLWLIKRAQRFHAF
jgi:HNH endonuclease